MEPIIHEINLNLAQPNNFQYIHAMQGDYDSIIIKATLYDGNNLYSIRSSTASLSGNLPDGTFITENVSIIDEHTVQFSLSKKLLMLDGDVRLVINITTNDKHLSTFPFIIKVLKSPDGDISDEDLASLKDYLEKAEYYATLSQSYAVDGTGLRDGEKTDNSKYYYEKAKEIYDKLSDSGDTSTSSSNANILYFETYDEYNTAKQKGDVLPETLVLINGSRVEEEEEKPPDENRIGSIWVSSYCDINTRSFWYSDDNGITWHMCTLDSGMTSYIEKINNTFVVGTIIGGCYSKDNAVSWSFSQAPAKIVKILNDKNNKRLLGIHIDSSRVNMYINYTEDGILWNNLVEMPVLHSDNSTFLGIVDFYVTNSIYYIVTLESEKGTIRRIYCSTDLNSWRELDIAGYNIGSKVTYFNNLYILAMGYYIYTSVDGHTFSEACRLPNIWGGTSQVISRYRDGRDVHNDFYILKNKIYTIADLDNSNTSLSVVYSEDGITWNKIDFLYYHLFVHNDKFYATKNSNKIYVSDDCTTWTEYSTLQDTAEIEILYMLD